MDADHVLHIGRVDFRNDNRLFGIKHEDRFSHLYIIGKTGTGKSTLIETMALQDLERGNGFALIDPHGDLVARIAARIPASQQQRVFYLNATDPAQPYGYNPLRHVAEDRIALAASGMIDVFRKMWPFARRAPHRRYAPAIEFARMIRREQDIPAVRCSLGDARWKTADHWRARQRKWIRLSPS
jgi:type IV secretory pathway TraG/TraD family ATPase VirD4